MYEKNTIARLIQIIGIITIIVGFVEGLLAGTIETGYYGSEFSIKIAIPIWIARFVSGIMCIGFSEVIALLHNIYLKLQKLDFQFKKANN